MKYRLLAFCLCFLALATHADEGMWLPGNLSKATRTAMKDLGLQLSADELYHPRRASLKDAVVSFGGFCSGVVVSRDGLVLTNHHCGFGSVQQHSTVEHDYLKNGFTARTRADELPCPDLYVRFLQRQEDVTRRVMRALKPGMDEMQRASAVDSMMMLIGAEASKKDSTLTGVVDAYYGGTEFWLSVYRDYNDVRLVYAPPSSIGKFGWDKDNWMWPRHTGDFCVFRIYADEHNRPASYHHRNVPYHARHVVPLSRKGYAEGDFCMTIGYPGSTERYLSSYGIEEMMRGQNQAQIDVRGVKQAIWKREMDKRDSIRIKYAGKYDESSNYWKNSIGVNRALRKLKVIEKKRAMEREMQRWLNRQILDGKGNSTRLDSATRSQCLHLFNDLKLGYRNRAEADRAGAYLAEAFLNGPELVQQAFTLLNFDFEGDDQTVFNGLKKIVERYANLDVEIDKEVFTAMLHVYRAKVSAEYLPGFYQTIDTLYAGDARAYVDSLYASTRLDTSQGLSCLLNNDSTYNIYQDPAIDLCIDLLGKLFEMNTLTRSQALQIDRCERLYQQAVRRMYADRNFYPDANGTMRLSFGTVGGYSPFDGACYNHFTTTQGILEKVSAHQGDPDFEVQPAFLNVLRRRDFGPYADEEGEMRVCFISNNDITGGNSGSAMFNARGELLGLAFDGNWEAMSGDILFEPRMQRTIGVDIRYVLFVMERYGEARHLVEEMTFLK